METKWMIHTSQKQWFMLPFEKYTQEQQGTLFPLLLVTSQRMAWVTHAQFFHLQNQLLI